MCFAVVGDGEVVLMRETAYKTRGKGEVAAEYGFGVQGGCVRVTVVCGYE
jgi:hypothetical protein